MPKLPTVNLPRLIAKQDALKPLPPISVDKKEKVISKSKITATVVVCLVMLIIATAAGVPIALTNLSKLTKVSGSKLYQFIPKLMLSFSILIFIKTAGLRK